MHDPTDQGELSAEEFRRRGHEVIDWIAAYLERAGDLPVLSRAQPGQLLGALPEQAPDGPVAWEQTLAELETLILPGVTHWNHPRFFAYFANTGSAAGILGAAVAAALNPNGMLWRTSPAATELELRVVDWVREWMGLPAGWFGIINDTASTSTLVALAAARQTAPGYRATDGVHACERPLRLYASEQSHSSVDKAALILGLGLDAVRKVPTGRDYGLQAEALAAMIAADRQRGEQPFAVVATVGTTATTSVDPVAEIAAICDAEKLWLHVDAAYAGPAAIVPEERAPFSGWDAADSLVVNPHKWLFTPMCCSLLYSRRPGDLRDAFSLVPEYLRSDVGDARGQGEEGVRALPDLMNYGVQLGRPFRSLVLWLVISTYGRAGIESRLRAHLEMARDLAAMIDDDPDFERLAPTPFSAVCFRYNPGIGAGSGDGTQLDAIDEDPLADLNERLLEAVNADGTSFLSHARLRGRLALRLAIGNLRTEQRDVTAAWETVRDLASTLER